MSVTCDWARPISCDPAPTSTVQLAGGNRFAPSSRRPVIVAGRDEFEQLGIDLRQVRDLDRMAVYAFSESRQELAWGGTLVVTTSGGAQIELPLESLYAGRVAVLITIYNLAGELVIRAEMETILGDVRRPPGRTATTASPGATIAPRSTESRYGAAACRADGSTSFFTVLASWNSPIARISQVPAAVRRNIAMITALAGCASDRL